MGKNYNKKYGQNFSFEGKPVEIAEEIEAPVIESEVETVIEAEPEIINKKETVEVTPVVEAEEVIEEKKEEIKLPEKKMVKVKVVHVSRYSVRIVAKDGKEYMVQGHTDAKVGDMIEIEE